MADRYIDGVRCTRCNTKLLPVVIGQGLTCFCGSVRATRYALGLHVTHFQAVRVDRIRVRTMAPCPGTPGQ